MSTERITWTKWSDDNSEERTGKIGDVSLFIAHRWKGGTWLLDTRLPPLDRLGSFESFAEASAAAEAALEEFVARVGARFPSRAEATTEAGS